MSQPLQQRIASKAWLVDEDEETALVCLLADLERRLAAAERDYDIVSGKFLEDESNLAKARERVRVLESALHHIAITDDEDCRHANNPAAMTRIAREALAAAPAPGHVARLLPAQATAILSGAPSESAEDRARLKQGEIPAHLAGAPSAEESRDDR